jgi:hypothetical protein
MSLQGRVVTQQHTTCTSVSCRHTVSMKATVTMTALPAAGMTLLATGISLLATGMALPATGTTLLATGMTLQATVQELLCQLQG